MGMPQVKQCDICGEEAAIMSQMDLSDWSCIHVGQNCLVPFLVSMIQGLTGMEPDMTGVGGAAADSPADAPQGSQETPPEAGAGDGTPEPPKRAAGRRAPRGKAAGQ